MLFIGVTGGVGAGKSAILAHLEEHYKSRVMLADLIAHDVMEPGTACFQTLQTMFADDDVWQENGAFDRPKLARVLFSDEEKREALNSVVHPAVDVYVQDTIRTEREKEELDLLVLEAALLIEQNYDAICDELWYIYTSEENRRVRLKANRGYSDEKIDNILKSQLPEEVFRAHCRVVIDNNGTPEEAFAQIDRVLAKRGIAKCR